MNLRIYQSFLTPIDCSNSIVNYIERGHGIIVSVDAGVLWKKHEYVGVGHAIMAYGTIHKYDTGKLIGLILCDTGSGEMEFPLPIVLFEQMYHFERGANVTLERSGKGFRFHKRGKCILEKKMFSVCGIPK